ncbi:MAG: NHL domain/cytochrome c family protein [Gammaproteobacteria bacterium]|nr:NHL domain/cytochrome c family protein [Gammaproteobacteria bacterium]
MLHHSWRYCHRLLIVIGLLIPAICPASPVVIQQTTVDDQLHQPTRAIEDNSGHVFILDGASHQVIKIDNSGKRTRFGSKQLRLPMDITLVDDNTLIIADSGHHRLLEFSTQGKLLRSLKLKSAPVPNAAFGPPSRTDTLPSEPVAVAVQHRNVWWSDRRHHRVCATDLDTAETSNCFGQPGMENGDLQFPYQIAIDNDEYVAVVDTLNARVQLFNRLGDHVQNIGHFGIRPGEMYRPNGTAYDDQGFQFVSDSYQGTISVYRSGQFLHLLADQTGKPMQFNTPTGLSWHNNILLVADTGASRIYKLTLSQADQPNTPLPTRTDSAKQNCVICHLSWSDDYTPHSAGNPEAPPVATSKMCYSCHHGVIIDSRNQIGINGQHPSIHDAEKIRQKRLKTERKDNIADEFPLTANKELLCTTCHTPHSNDTSGDALYAEHHNTWMRNQNKGGDMCEKCHESNADTARKRHPEQKGQNHPLAFQLSKPPFKNAKNYSTDAHLQKGLPEALNLSGASLGRVNEMICQTCHQVHGGSKPNLLAITDSKGQLCKTCHRRQHSDSKKQARKKGVHPVNIKLDDLELDEPVKIDGKTIKTVTCQTCHQIHDGQPGTVLLPRQIKTTEELCVTCHQRQHAEDKDDAIRKGVHPVNAKLDEPVKIKGKQIKVVGCLSCHAVHSGVNNTPALVEDHHDGQLCEHCHDSKQEVVGTDHDLRITAKDKPNQHDELPEKSGVCGTCHSLHRGNGKRLYLAAVKPVNTSTADHPERDPVLLKTDALCLECHQKHGLAEDKPIDQFAHPFKSIVLRSDKDTLPLLSKTEEKPEDRGMIACITCHEPHHWKPKSEQDKTLNKANHPQFKDNQEGTVLNSFLRLKGVKNTFCVDCHGINALLKYKYYHDKTIVQEESLDYIK